MDIEYTCEECGWAGLYVEVIRAGLSYELCPECEAPVHSAGNENDWLMYVSPDEDEQNREE